MYQTYLGGIPWGGILRKYILKYRLQERTVKNNILNEPMKLKLTRTAVQKQKSFVLRRTPMSVKRVFYRNFTLVIII